MMTKPYGNYDKEPVKRIESCRAYEGYGPITEAILRAAKDNENPVIVLETYTQVDTGGGTCGTERQGVSCPGLHGQ